MTRYAASAGATAVAYSDDGFPLCRRCGWKLASRHRRFCSAWCVDLWNLQRSGVSVRYWVWERDRGVCARCQLDTNALEGELHILQRVARDGTSLAWNTVAHLERQHGAGTIAERKRILQAAAAEVLDWRLTQLWVAMFDVRLSGSFGATASGWSTLWHADHIVAVVEGGGASDLSNFRTLCVPCHKAETRALHRRRVADRRGQPQLFDR